MAVAGKTCIVTGANRSIGLEFVRQLTAKGNRVIAAVRQPSQAGELANMSSVVLTQLDVADPASVATWAQSVKALTPRVDVVINNAGVYGPRATLEQFKPEDFLLTFQVNALGPFLVVQALHHEGLLGGEEPTLVATVTSKMGSIEDNTSGGSYAYRASKAAVNIMAKSLSIDLADQNVTSTLLHPGYVMTDMTGGKGNISAQTSVAGMLAVLDRPLPELQGTWSAWDGKRIPW